MNEFEKGIQKAQKGNCVKLWWNKNGYKVLRIIFFPLYLISLYVEKYNKEMYKKLEYSDDKAKMILDKYLPLLLKNSIEENGSFLLTTDSGEYNTCWDFWYFPDKIKNKKNQQYYYKYIREIKEYFENKYEIEGYEKYCSKDLQEFKKISGLSWYHDYPKAYYFKKI